jgi:hypothetical protein
MDQGYFIIYLSPRDVILSRGTRRLVGESVEVLKFPHPNLSTQSGLVHPIRTSLGPSRTSLWLSVKMSLVQLD